VGRHTYDAQVFVPTDNSGVVWTAEYAYAGLGMPVVTANASQEWENWAAIRDDHGVLQGTLRRRTLDESLGFVFLRPRYRTFTSFSLSAGLESHDFGADPAGLLSRIDSSFQTTSYYPLVLASVAWSNAQRPLLSISPEDGLEAAATVRERFASGSAADATFSAVSVASAYKSLDFPGFGHHALAFRGAAGYSDNRATDYLEVGGASGSYLTVIPGVVVGEGSKTFPVRGFNSATLIGLRAFSGTAEYRVPLSLLDNGWGMLPVFADRGSVSLFYDVGGAWCPRVLSPGSLCTSPLLTPHTTIASAGAELNLSAAVLQWDTPYRFNVGAALPVRGRTYFGSSVANVYFTIGLTF